MTCAFLHGFFFFWQKMITCIYKEIFSSRLLIVIVYTSAPRRSYFHALRGCVVWYSDWIKYYFLCLRGEDEAEE